MMSDDTLDDHLYTIRVGESDGIELIGALIDACNATDGAYNDLLGRIADQLRDEQ